MQTPLEETPELKQELRRTWQAAALKLVENGAPAPSVFEENGRQTAESNEAFDADLRRRNPEWGVRDLEDVCAAAARHGLRLDEKIEMPANNLSIVFRVL